MPVHRLGAGHAQHLTCEQAYYGYEIVLRVVFTIVFTRKMEISGQEINTYKPFYILNTFMLKVHIMLFIFLILCFKLYHPKVFAPFPYHLTYRVHQKPNTS
jgi:hypothetical protein